MEKKHMTNMLLTCDKNLGKFRREFPQLDKGIYLQNTHH